VKKELLELARRLGALDSASDEALELARQALLAGPGLPYRLESALGAVLATWAERVVAHAAKRGPKLSDRSEVAAEARLWILEQLREYRPAEDGGSVAVFLRARLSWFRSAARRSQDGAGRTHSSYTVGSAAGYVRERFLREQHREPSSSELKAAVADLLTEQTKEKVLASAEFADEEALARAVDGRLKKDGLAAALERFDEIRLESSPLLPLQTLTPREEDPRPNWGVALPVVEDPGFDQRDPEEDYERLLAVALGEQQWARAAFSARAGEVDAGAEGSAAGTLRDLAADADCSIAELKAVLVAARSRVFAPHAQWAHLSPSLVVDEAN